MGADKGATGPCDRGFDGVPGRLSGGLSGSGLSPTRLGSPIRLASLAWPFPLPAEFCGAASY